MRGYSDRIHHALAFAAKHYGKKAPTGLAFGYLVHPASMALYLTRHECDEPTIVAGIVHHVLEEADGRARRELEQKVGEKFGSVVLAIARDAVEPKYDDRGSERPWRVCKQDYLMNLASAEPRALDICVADEIQVAGTTLTAVRRLGTEYLHTISRASSEQTIWWYRSLLEILDGRPEWPHRPMLDDLRQMSAELVRRLRRTEEEI
jgi:(p)ppGpp synthase/HD superfamily hydrolase